MPTNISTDYCVELLTNGCENITPAFGPVFADWPDSGKRVGHGRSDDRLGSRAKPFTYARRALSSGAVLNYVIPAVSSEATKGAPGGRGGREARVSNITDNATATVLKMCGLFDGDGAGIPAREPHHLKRVSAVGRR